MFRNAGDHADNRSRTAAFAAVPFRPSDYGETGPRMLVRLAVACLLCLLVRPASAGGTNVRGTLWLTSSARARAAKSAGVPAVQAGVTEGVIWVEAIPADVEARLATPTRGWFRRRPVPEVVPSVARRNEAFAPRVTAVPAGGRVEFASTDRYYHSTFSVSGAKRFDLGKRAPGVRDTVDFRRPGVVNLHCEIHPGEVGFVVVTPNHAYARPDSAGRFGLPRLPAGKYVLRAWHPRKGELSLRFEVPKRGSVELDPTF